MRPAGQSRSWKHRRSRRPELTRCPPGGVPPRRRRRMLTRRAAGTDARGSSTRADRPAARRCRMDGAGRAHRRPARGAGGHAARVRAEPRLRHRRLPVLYVDGKACGVIEAKKQSATLTAVEAQSARYAPGLPCAQAAALWRGRRGGRLPRLCRPVTSANEPARREFDHRRRVARRPNLAPAVLRLRGRDRRVTARVCRGSTAREAG